jgi:DNA-binding NtrC family response regulator
VDDTPANLDLLTQVLEPQGYEILAAASGEIAVKLADKAVPDLILLDVILTGIDGYETCRQLHANATTRDIPVLFISARDETQSLVDAFTAGGVDYITKPFQADEVLIRIRTHLQISQLARQLRRKNEELLAANQRLRDEVNRRERAETALAAADEQLENLSEREAERWGIAGFMGKSKTIDRILRDVRRLQNFGTVNALITGESGTGKELIARAIHFGSAARSKGPFVAVNCVAIPSELAESMLFGHVRGAFTGATMDRKGYFELAHGGTLFLDEIGDMPPALQAKLLRVLEDGRVTPLGAMRERQVNVRVVAATNVELESKINGGEFRQDLYFRLAQFTVALPPLRDRPEDIPLLAMHFLRLFATDMGLTAPAVDRAVFDALAAHPFPGNVRELKNVIERALMESSGGATLRLEHLHLVTRPGEAAPPSTSRRRTDGSALTSPGEARIAGDDLPLNLEAAENLLIRRALTETGGNIAEAARMLGINRTRIYRKLSEQAEAAES